MKRQILLAFVTMAAGVLAAETPAHAVPVLVGNSTGTLTCSSGTCSQSGTAAVILGTASPTGWMLTAVPINPFTADNANSNVIPGVQLAELTFAPRPNPNGTATFAYNLALTFTTPSGAQSQNFSLATSSIGGTGSNSTQTISGLTLTLPDPLLLLPNLGLYNFRFVNVDAGCMVGNCTFSNGSWTVKGTSNQNANLFLETDVVVPEPVSLVLFGTGLLGLGLLGRKRRRAG
jgi:hypothetical protein